MRNLTKQEWRTFVIICSVFTAGFITAWAIDDDGPTEHIVWLLLGFLWFGFVYLAIIRRKP